MELIWHSISKLVEMQCQPTCICVLPASSVKNMNICFGIAVWEFWDCYNTKPRASSPAFTSSAIPKTFSSHPRPSSARNTSHVARLTILSWGLDCEDCTAFRNEYSALNPWLKIVGHVSLLWMKSHNQVPETGLWHPKIAPTENASVVCN